MIVKRWIAAAVLLGFSPLLGSCGGGAEGGFSGYVADHWPHWAGGMPDDVPPRPGAPGYDEFIAHGQVGQDSTKSTSPGGQSVASAPVKPVFQTTPPAAQRETPPETQAAPETQTAPEPSVNNSPEDPSVVKGGLY
jgi:cell division septation protein DedD